MSALRFRKALCPPTHTHILKVVGQIRGRVPWDSGRPCAPAPSLSHTHLLNSRTYWRICTPKFWEVLCSLNGGLVPLNYGKSCAPIQIGGLVSLYSGRSCPYNPFGGLVHDWRQCSPRFLEALWPHSYLRTYLRAYVPKFLRFCAPLLGDLCP